MKKSAHRKRRIRHIWLTFFATFMSVTVLGTVAIVIYHAVGKSRGETSVVFLSSGDGQGSENSLFAESIPQEPREKQQETERENKEAKPQGKYSDILADAEYMKENYIYAKETASQGEVTLAFGGDILFDPGYSVMAKMLQRGGEIEKSISQDLLQEMRSADIFMLNNEFPYSQRGTPTVGKQFTFRAKPESVEVLKEMGADIVSLANNHAYDYGEAALLDTFEILEEAEMPYVGAGRDLEQAAAPVYFIAGDLKIAFVSATQIERLDNPDTKAATEQSPGVFRCLNPEQLLHAIGEAEKNSDFVVVYIHWGTENTPEPDWLQLDQAPKIVEAGADLVIGDHPHCLQPVEFVDGVPVFYSLGNFWFNSKTLDTCLVKAVVDENGLKSLQFLPALQQNCETSLLHGAEKERTLHEMRNISPGVRIDEEGYITEQE